MSCTLRKLAAYYTDHVWFIIQCLGFRFNNEGFVLGFSI